MLDHELKNQNLWRISYYNWDYSRKTWAFAETKFYPTNKGWNDVFAFHRRKGYIEYMKLYAEELVLPGGWVRVRELTKEKGIVTEK
jgi:hypothetical protein